MIQVTLFGGETKSEPTKIVSNATSLHRNSVHTKLQQAR